MQLILNGMAYTLTDTWVLVCHSHFAVPPHFTLIYFLNCTEFDVYGCGPAHLTSMIRNGWLFYFVCSGYKKRCKKITQLVLYTSRAIYFLFSRAATQ